MTAPIILDPATNTVTHGDRVATLRPKETALLAVMVCRGGALVPIGELMLALWPNSDDVPSQPYKAFRVFLCRLRRVLAHANIPARIDTVVGQGCACGNVRLADSVTLTMTRETHALLRDLVVAHAGSAELLDAVMA